MNILLILIAISYIVISAKYLYEFRSKYLRECCKSKKLQIGSNQQETCINQLQNELQNIQEHLEAQEQGLKEKDNRIQELYSSSSQQETYINQLQNALHNSEEQLKTQEQELKAKDNTVHSQGITIKKLEECHGNLDKVNQTIQKQKKDRDELEQEISGLHHLYDSLHTLDRITSEGETLKQEKKELIEANQILSIQLSEIQDKLSKDEQDSDRERTLDRIKIVSACHRHQSKLFHVEIDTEFSSVMNALQFANRMFGDILEIWDTAYESAQKSQFRRHDRVYLALQDLALFGRHYISNEGSIGMDIYRFLQRTYHLESSSESESIQNSGRLSGERIFTNGERKKKMLRHLKLRGRGRGLDSKLRIYFEPNLETGKVEVGYCGRHLPT